MNYDQQQLANDLVRERANQRFATQRPQHPRAARLLRRLANRMESTEDR